jgi:hypothetical protein
MEGLKFTTFIEAHSGLRGKSRYSIFNDIKPGQVLEITTRSERRYKSYVQGYEVKHPAGDIQDIKCLVGGGELNQLLNKFDWTYVYR